MSLESHFYWVEQTTADKIDRAPDSRIVSAAASRNE